MLLVLDEGEAESYFLLWDRRPADWFVGRRAAFLKLNIYTKGVHVCSPNVFGRGWLVAKCICPGVIGGQIFLVDKFFMWKWLVAKKPMEAIKGFPKTPSQLLGQIWQAAKKSNQTPRRKSNFKKWWGFQKSRHNSNGLRAGQSNSMLFLDVSSLIDVFKNQVFVMGFPETPSQSEVRFWPPGFDWFLMIFIDFYVSIYF